MFTGRAAADFTGYNRTRVDADPYGQFMAGCLGEALFQLFRHLGDDLQAGVDSPSGVIAERQWVTEVTQNAVTKVLGYKARIELKKLGTLGLVAFEDLAIVFCIELLREFGRVNKVAEYDRDQTTLCIVVLALRPLVRFARSPVLGRGLGEGLAALRAKFEGIRTFGLAGWAGLVQWLGLNFVHPPQV